MNAQLATQIAKHLQVSPNQIKEIREWAKVFWVAVHGKRPTFVSKKVAKVEEIDPRIPQTLEEAREFTKMRFHEWDEECRQVCQKLMFAGVDEDVLYPAHPMFKEVYDLEITKDDCRTPVAVVKIAYQLTHN